MQVIRDPEDLIPVPQGSVVTIGVYDGVHRGHQAVISDVCRRARDQKMRSVVVTFDPHPASVIRPELTPPLLTGIEHRLELLGETGVDMVFVLHFDEARSRESAEDFVTELLVGKLSARVVVVGSDFHFGHNRRGDVAFLTEMGVELGFEVDGIDLVTRRDGTDDGVISSTSIRKAVRLGEVDRAGEMLGRPYEVRGTVGDGDKRARGLGFPTANVGVPEGMCMPRDGIYAGWYLTPDGECHPTAISLGRRPTFYEDATRSVLEAHLLDFSGDLYGQPARVQFVSRLRDEIKFDSVDALIAQMGRDCDVAREVLGVSC